MKKKVCGILNLIIFWSRSKCMNLFLLTIKVRMINSNFIWRNKENNNYFYLDNSKHNFQTFYEAKRKFMKMSVEGFNLPEGKKDL